MGVEIIRGTARRGTPYREDSSMVKAPTPRPTSTVTCHYCSHRVALSTTERLPEEFTVRCPSCGRRDFYRPKEVRTIDGEQTTKRAS
jgi:DNA-directed RNA polymerase subunit RPC12/RpoP